MAASTYDSALNLADQVNQHYYLGALGNSPSTDPTTPTSPVSYDDIKNKITSNAYTPQYQTADGLSNLTSSYLSSMEPTWQATKNTINQQYDNSEKVGQSNMANMGLGRSGASFNNLQANEQNRNNAIGSAYGDLTSTAQTNALNAANLGLNEQSMVNSQNNAAVSQLSNLLSQYNTDQQNAISNALSEANLTGTYNGNQTLAAQQLAATLAQQAILNAQNQATLTGKYQTGTNADGTPIYSDTLAAQQLANEQEQAKNQLAAAIAAAYAQGTDKYTLPKSIVTLLDNLFKTTTTTT